MLDKILAQLSLDVVIPDELNILRAQNQKKNLPQVQEEDQSPMPNQPAPPHPQHLEYQMTSTGTMQF